MQYFLCFYDTACHKHISVSLHMVNSQTWVELWYLGVLVNIRDVVLFNFPAPWSWIIVQLPRVFPLMSCSQDDWCCSVSMDMMKLPSCDLLGWVSGNGPAWMLGARALFWLIHMTITQCGPSPALHPFLPCYSLVARQPELNIGPYSPNFPSSPSKAFLSSLLCSLPPLSPSSSSSFSSFLPLFSLSFFLLVLPFANSPWWGL